MNENQESNNVSDVNIVTKEYLIPDEEKSNDDYNDYTVKVFRSVPSTCVLVCRNKYSGAVTKLGPGFHLVAPWKEAKLIYVGAKTLDYPKEVYTTKDNVEVTIDLAIRVRVSYPVMFETKSQNPLQEVGILAKKLMRTYVSTLNADTLRGKNISLSDIDENGEFKKLEKSVSGVNVDTVYVKSIELPDNMLKSFSDIADANNREKVAIIEARTNKLKAETEASSTRILVEQLKNAGLTSDQIVNLIINSKFAAKDGAQVIANLNGDSNLSSAQIVANAINGNNGYGRVKK